MSQPQSDLYRRPVELLQALIRFDTTNPPGNEAACIAYVEGLLREAGLETTIVARDEARPNLVARLPGGGEAPPLLFYGHVDVVTTEGQQWTYPPFEGRVADGCVWGRGALDMKGAVAAMLAALLRARAEGLVPAGDLLLALVSDEESSGIYGARYLVEEHGALFEGVRYAIGEVGGMTTYIAGQKLYPIMVSEKQTCGLRATLRGQGGHGALPVRGGAMARLGRMLQALDRHRLPAHVTPVARQMIETIAALLPFPQDRIVRLLLHPRLANRVLDLLGPMSRTLDPLLHNTVSATVVQASTKVNVIPSRVHVDLDGRLLPGFRPDDMLAELRPILGPDVELEVVLYEPGPPEPDMGLFDTLAGIVREADPEGRPSPLLVAGVTDARYFARLGIQTYGFTPAKLPPDLEFWNLVHAADERIPIDALDFGVAATYELLQRYGRDGQGGGG
ncbi:MAG: M20/M25/M40 family metallo-hydrolase [Anaerolineae bacterium]|jgi:acetylornithine deacetylase/succinyl-diaminopimelate desuccinylase-like protein